VLFKSFSAMFNCAFQTLKRKGWKWQEWMAAAVISCRSSKNLSRSVLGTNSSRPIWTLCTLNTGFCHFIWIRLDRYCTMMSSAPGPKLLSTDPVPQILNLEFRIRNPDPDISSSCCRVGEKKWSILLTMKTQIGWNLKFFKFLSCVFNYEEFAHF